MGDTQVAEAGTGETTSPGDLSAEIDDAVEAVMDEVVRENEPPAEEKPAEAEEPVADEKPAGDPDDEPEELPNELIERAVKAGLSLAEVKQYPNEGLLTAMCDRIEGFNGEGGSQDGAADEGPGEDPPAADDALLKIPDLDPDEFDERIVAWAKSVVGVVKQQQETIRDLRSGQSQDWFTVQAEGVKDFTKGDPEKVAAVREKFDVLQAGYEAAGQQVSRESAFSEATKLVLGAEMEAAKASAKKRAAKRRSGQRIQRPEGSRTAGKSVDPETEIAEELDRKFFS